MSIFKNDRKLIFTSYVFELFYVFGQSLNSFQLTFIKRSFDSWNFNFTLQNASDDFQGSLAANLFEAIRSASFKKN